MITYVECAFLVVGVTRATYTSISSHGAKRIFLETGIARTRFNTVR